jgi:hypothetical protein
LLHGRSDFGGEAASGSSLADVGGHDLDAIEVGADLAVVEVSVMVGLEEVANEQFHRGLAVEGAEMVGLLAGQQTRVVDLVVVIAEVLSAERGRATGVAGIVNVLTARCIGYSPHRSPLFC